MNFSIFSILSTHIFCVQYSINKSKSFLGFVGPHWEQHIVAELDSALNEWIDTVPGHRAYLCFGRFNRSIDRLGQSNGIQQARTFGISDGSCSPQAYTVIIITSKF
jgi:hypothetical protein